MKRFHRALAVFSFAALLPVLLATFAPAQTIPQNAFQHIIIVVQENRTPDNLFGYWATAPGGPSTCPPPLTFAGADIANWGNSSGNGGAICNVQQAMNNGGAFDPGHEFEDWTADYDSPVVGMPGQMDGFCHEYTNSQCPNPSTPSPYSYINPGDVNPYYSIATTYGFANYMFQTNEGPSMVAHQFLFTGTSAPVAPNDVHNYYWDFVQDNPQGTVQQNPNNDSGCASSLQAPWIEPNGTKIDSNLPFECYAHDSLVTTSDPNTGDVMDKISSWTYYSPLQDNDQQQQVVGAGYIWNAPEAIPEVCYGVNNTNSAGTACGGAEWNAHMNFYSTMDASVLQDIASCNLPSISWVIPDLAWSDHPSYDGTVHPALGPSWVADIVNAIGNSHSGGRCDYWGYYGGNGISVEPTAIFVVWDDWGGFYDHISPYLYPNVWTGSSNGTGGWNCGAPNQWGCGYTYGFRVPLLVVSEFTGTGTSTTGYSGYISGECGTTNYPNCPSNNFPYVHDFGSILAFTEHNFGLNNIDLSGDNGYADYNAPDWGPLRNNVPLSDFFALWTGTGSIGRPFQQILSNYDPSFFENYYVTHVPVGPDTD
jgi:phospholipase C